MLKAVIIAIVVAFIVGTIAFYGMYLGLKFTGNNDNFRPALYFGLYFAIAVAAITVPVFLISAKP